MPRLLFTAIVSLTAATSSSAWVAPNNAPLRSAGSGVAQDRRDFLAKLVVGTAAAPLLVSSPALAAPAQEQKDKENIVKGYNRLQYLLDNWEKETTICKIGQEVNSCFIFML